MRMVLALLLSVASSATFAQEQISQVTTQELARRVADYAASQDDRVVIVIKKSVFEVSLVENRAGVESLSVSRYDTTLNLELPSPGHVVAEQFIWGQPKIYMEGHFFDSGITGIPTVFQLFTKYRNGAYEGFTREERDHRRKTGVSEEIYHSGEIRRSRGILFWRRPWRKATQEERFVAQEAYRHDLKVLVTHLKLQ